MQLVKYEVFHKYGCVVKYLQRHCGFCPGNYQVKVFTTAIVCVCEDSNLKAVTCFQRLDNRGTGTAYARFTQSAYCIFYHILCKQIAWQKNDSPVPSWTLLSRILLDSFKPFAFPHHGSCKISISQIVSPLYTRCIIRRSISVIYAYTHTDAHGDLKKQYLGKFDIFLGMTNHTIIAESEKKTYS